MLYNKSKNSNTFWPVCTQSVIIIIIEKFSVLLYIVHDKRACSIVSEAVNSLPDIAADACCMKSLPAMCIGLSVRNGFVFQGLLQVVLCLMMQLCYKKGLALLKLMWIEAKVMQMQHRRNMLGHWSKGVWSTT